MMDLNNDTSKFLKNNLHEFLNGDYDDKFSSGEIERAIELSFILNHISIDNKVYKIEFKYNNIIISMRLDLDDLMYGSAEDMIISTIRNSEDFKSAFKIFLRDYKLGKILKK